MSFMELSKARYSVRAFQNTPIEEEKMNLILEAGRVAPLPATISPKRSTLPRVKMQKRSSHPSVALPSVHR